MKTGKMLSRTPIAMQKGLKGESPTLVRDIYFGGDEATKADIEAFFVSDGPAKVDRALKKIRRRR